MSTEGSSGEPLVGDLYGMRYFRVGFRSLIPATLARYRFRAGINIARCGHGHGHRPGDPNCTCGFHAYYEDSPDRLCSPYGERWSVKGIIAASGQVTSAEFGFRAERAQIVALVDDDTERRKATRDALLGVLCCIGVMVFIVLWDGALLPTLPLVMLAPLAYFLSFPMMLHREWVMASYGVPVFPSEQEALARYPLSSHPQDPALESTCHEGGSQHG